MISKQSAAYMWYAKSFVLSWHIQLHRSI